MKVRSIIFWVLASSAALCINHLNAGVTRGSDTAVSIIPVSGLTGKDNSIKTFGNAKHGFQFADANTTCSFYSSFPVSGPISLRGGTLYLNSDLILTNTATLADVGSIEGQSHAIDLAAYQNNFVSRTNASGARVLTLQSRVNMARNIKGVSWSPDNAYLAVITDNYRGSTSNHELFIYSFTGNILTLVTSVNLAVDGHDVHWHPSASAPYYLAVACAASGATNDQIRVYSFNETPSALDQKVAINAGDGVTIRSIAWQGRGNYLAAAGSVIQGYKLTSPYTAATKVGDDVAITGQTYYNSVAFAPAGNQDDFIVGTSSGFLYLYTISASALTQRQAYDFSANGAINCLDWAPTSTFIAIACGSNKVATYQHAVADNSITAKTTFSTNTAVQSVSWKPTVTELAVGAATSASSDNYYSLDFNTGSYALTNKYSTHDPAGINVVRYSRDSTGTYMVRADKISRYVSVYKESYKPYTFKDATIFLNNNITLGTPLSFSGTCTINGRGNKITFTSDGALNIAQGSSLETQFVNLEFKKPNAFALQGPTSKLKLRETNILLSDDIVFGDGVMETYDDVTFTGPHTFYLATSITSTIHSHSILAFENLAKLKLGRIILSGNNPLEFEDSESRLNLNDGSLVVTHSGLALKKGIINIYGQSDFDIDLTETAIAQLQGLTLGDRTSNNDVTVKLHGNGATLNIASDTTGKGAFVLNEASRTFLQFYGNAKWSLDSTSSLHIQHDISLTDGWCDMAPTAQTYFGANVKVLCDDFKVTDQLQGTDYIVTGTYGSRWALTLDNGGSVLVNSGAVPNTINVQRHNNIIDGTGDLTGAVTLNDANTTLSIDMATNIDNYNITNNGGKLIIGSDVAFAHSYTIAGNGTVQLNGNEISLGNQESTWTSTLYFDGDESLFDFNADLNLTGKWTFSRDCVVDGHGHELDLHNTGTIIIERGSTLRLRNMAIENLSRISEIVGSDVNSELILDNCTIQISDGYNNRSNGFKWTTGKIKFVNDVNFMSSGTFDTQYTFSYESAATSEVYEHSHVNIFDNINFAIGKKTTTSAQPIEFEDNTGSIDLWGGKLTINSNGMILTKGAIRNCRASTIDIRSSTNGLTLGDGTSVNDAKLQVGLGGGSTLIVKNGRLFYNNASSTNRITFDNERATLKFLNGAGLTAQKDLALSSCTLDFPSESTLVEDGGTITQSSVTHKHGSPYAVHKISSSTLYPYTIPSNGVYLTTEGTTSTKINVASGTASLGGSAKIAADIVLNGASTTLNAYLIPTLNGNIILKGGLLSLSDNFGFEGTGTFTAYDADGQATGRLNLNNLKLTLGTADLSVTSSLIIDSTSSQIELNSTLDFYGTWTFGSGICTINGRSNVLDLSHGGMITIRPNTTVVLDNLTIKGLGHKRNNFIFMDKTSQLKLHNCSIGLDRSITTTQGGIYVDSVSFMRLKNNNWTFDSAGSLTVDGATLWKDQLGAAHGGNILFGSGTQLKFLTLLSTGTIKALANQDLIYTSTNALGTRITTLEADGAGITTHTTHVNYATDTTISQPELFKQGFTVSAGKTLNIDVTLPVAGNLNLSGSGTLDLDGDLILDSGAYLTSGGIIKGDNNTLILTSSFVIPPSSRLKITGNLVIDGQGNNFVVGQGAQLIIDPSISVTLRNLNWFNSNTEPHLEMRADNANLTLDTVNVCFDRNFNFTQGRMFIFNDVTVTGSTKVSFSSTKPLYIEPFSTLYFDLGTTFSYSPYPDRPHANAERTLLRLIDRTSQLYFDTCTIALPDAGMQLTRGTVCFDNKVIVNGNTSALTSANSFELGDGIATDTDVEIKVLGGAHVEMNGLMWHHVYTS